MSTYWKSECLFPANLNFTTRWESSELHAPAALTPGRATRLPTDWVPELVRILQNKMKPAPGESQIPNTQLLSRHASTPFSLSTLYNVISHKIYEALKFCSDLDTLATELDHTINLLKKRG